MTDSETLLPADISDQLWAYRAHRTADAIGVLARLPGSDEAVTALCQLAVDDRALAFSLVCQALEAIEVAIGRGEADQAAAVLALAADRSKLHPLPAGNGVFILLAADFAKEDFSFDRGDMPTVTLSSQACDRVSTAQRHLTASAIEAALEWGFGDLVADNARFIVLLRERALHESASSWTTNRLPGSLHLDYYTSPLLIARDLIHEASHNFLNDTTAALGIDISSEHRYYSPWKKTLRPAFGIIHAVWAFSNAVVYCAQLAGDARCPAVIRRLAAGFAVEHRQNLERVGHDASSILATLGSSSLKGLIAAQFNQALACASLIETSIR